MEYNNQKINFKVFVQCSQNLLNSSYKVWLLFQEQTQIEQQEDILRLLSDQYSRKIINSIQDEPKSASQISKDVGTELSIIYRRLHKLEKHNLLKTMFKITSDGKKSYYYQCKINGIDASYQKGCFKVILSFNQK